MSTPEREGVVRRAQARHAEQVRRAREDPVAFAEYVMLDETSLRPIKLAGFHREWHATFTRDPWLVLVAPVEHGKSVTVVSRVLWELGRDPDMRVALISEGEDQAKKLLGVIRRYIEESARLREVFPKLRRSTRDRHSWNELAIEIERSPFLRDPTIRAYGAGSRIAGSRLDLIVCDDILGPQNTATPEQNSKVVNWFDTVVLTRAQDKRSGARARVWVIGTPWADDDALAVLGARSAFAAHRYCAVENPDDEPRAWRPIWPEQWPLKRLFLRLDGMLPTAFARKYLTRVTHNIHARFPDWAIQIALDAGRGMHLLDRQPLVWPGPRKLRCWTGADLGIGEKDGHDQTALVTVAQREDGRRQLVAIESGRWTADEIIERLTDAHYRYDSRLVVESVAAQKFIVQLTRAYKKIPVEAFATTAANKWDEAFGIESIAVELRQKLWIFPSGNPGEVVGAEVQALRLEMTGYRPDAHTGDRLMALWFAREAMRKTLGRRFGVSHTAR